jgi:hypothetical protein
LRLLLDEHYSHLIATRLRDLGHDVVAVTERIDLVGLRDADLFALMAAERRAIVTENWGDFQRQLPEAATPGMAHYGLLFTSRRRLPRDTETIGLYVRVLDDFLARHPVEDALFDSYAWLPARPLPSSNGAR